MRKFFRAAIYLGCTLGPSALATYNSRIDVELQTALDGVSLTAQASPSCDLLEQWTDENSFPRTSNNKEFVASGAFPSSMPVANIRSLVNRNVKQVGASADWGPLPSGDGIAPDALKDWKTFDNGPISYLTLMVIVPNAVGDQTAVCYGVSRDNGQP